MATLSKAPVKKETGRETRSKEYKAAEKAVLAKNAELLVFLERFGDQIHDTMKQN